MVPSLLVVGGGDAAELPPPQAAIKTGMIAKTRNNGRIRNHER
jgi:hypothetical protein